MRPIPPALWALVFLTVGAGTAVAQLARPTSDTVFRGTAHSPVVSGVLEWFVPTAGFAYAGDWTRGFLPNAFRVATFIGVLATEENGTCEDACSGWTLGLLATTIWAVVDAVDTARDHNARARGTVAVSPHLERAPGGSVAVGLRLRR